MTDRELDWIEACYDANWYRSGAACAMCSDIAKCEQIQAWREKQRPRAELDNKGYLYDPVYFDKDLKPIRKLTLEDRTEIARTLGIIKNLCANYISDCEDCRLCRDKEGKENGCPFVSVPDKWDIGEIADLVQEEHDRWVKEY